MEDVKKGGKTRSHNTGNAAENTANETAATTNEAATGTAPEVETPAPEVEVPTMPAVNEPGKDFAGNPEGTKYDEHGRAIGEGLRDLPQDKDGTIQYNEDGSIFTPVAKEVYEAHIQSFRTNIAAAQVAINNKDNMIKQAEEMSKLFPDTAAAIQKNIEQIQIARQSDVDNKANLEKQLAEYRLSLVPPAARAIERELAKCIEERTALNERIANLENKRKLYNIEETPQSRPAGGGAKIDSAAERTPEQAAFHKMMVEKYGSQSKAIVAMVKDGKTNTEIYKALGIPPASVPGPKNDFLKSEEGKAWEVVEGRARLKA